MVAGLTALGASGCDGPGNSGRSGPPEGLVRDVPWLNGVLPERQTNGDPVIPGTPMYPPIGLGLAELGPDRVDCRGLDGYEFSAGWMESFEPMFADDPTATGLAAGWSSYDDLTKHAFHTPGDATWYPALKGTFDYAWGLPAEKKPGPSCDGKPNNWVLHFRGGLFRKWGGGISHAFADPVGRYRATPFEACEPGDDFCPAPLAAGAKVDSAGLPTTAASGEEYRQSHDFFDVSAYEGVAFWARRGPEGQDHTLIILTDKFNSGRLARENQKFCRRVRECHSRCLNGLDCSPGPPDDPTSLSPTYRCFDPKQGPLPKGLIDSLLDLMYPRCGASACTSPNTYKDEDFDRETCRPYSFPAADESGEYCWNGTDPPPDRDHRCQDGWQTTIQLTPDWKFYALPFSRFSQVGFGKRAPYMDLKSLDTIAFGATMGWADVYFDNVTFYRRKK